MGKYSFNLSPSVARGKMRRLRVRQWSESVEVFSQRSFLFHCCSNPFIRRLFGSKGLKNLVKEKKKGMKLRMMGDKAAKHSASDVWLSQEACEPCRP